MLGKNVTESSMNTGNLKIIGTSVQRVDGVDKVTGSAKYTGEHAFVSFRHLW